MSAPFKLPDSDDVKSIVRHFVYPLIGGIVATAGSAAYDQITQGVLDPSTIIANIQKTVLLAIASAIIRFGKRWMGDSDAAPAA